MTTPLIAGVSIAVAAVSLRAGIQQFIKYQAMPKKLHYYKGGFLPEMTRREAALILGVRESAVEERVKEAHRRIMIANHPDAGGSSYIAAKVNEAKDMMLGKSSKAGMF